jgi:hypothetical protein
MDLMRRDPQAVATSSGSESPPSEMIGAVPAAEERIRLGRELAALLIEHGRGVMAKVLLTALAGESWACKLVLVDLLEAAGLVRAAAAESPDRADALDPDPELERIVAQSVRELLAETRNLPVRRSAQGASADG